ncbi:hypothetical protein [Haloechinothrix sp. LS1_15]|uniref:hypothetical protein n=1 Tax=Haloechinothrix sp. LS1_15 TaxID=2652248 RepID=UPI00294ACFB0|nr:hypothetical protein [Haloechinothrix sp. LS1_15]
MRSPKHLLATITAGIVVVMAIGFVVPYVLADDDGDAGGSGDGYSDTRQGAAGDPGGTAGPEDQGAAEPAPPRLTEPRESPTPAEPSQEALEIAGLWAEAWVDHSEGDTVEEWLSGLRPYTTQEYLAVMESVDPANIPAEEVTGEPEAATSYVNSVEAEVPTDGPTLRITVVNTGAGWRVAHYEQAG